MRLLELWWSPEPWLLLVNQGLTQVILVVQGCWWNQSATTLLEAQTQGQLDSDQNSSFCDHYRFPQGSEAANKGKVMDRRDKAPCKEGLKSSVWNV